MKNEMDDLKQLWNNAKQATPSTTTAKQLIQQAAEKKKSSIYFQYGNILILTVVLLGLWVFFYRMYPFATLLSKIGTWLMLGGLALRICIEMLSVSRFGKIHVTDSALQNTSSTVSYYRFRKTIHGPVTFLIIAAYTIGYYLLMPEWSTHFRLSTMILLCCSYPVGAIILIKLIRKGIRKEMDDLKELIELQDELKE